jgi:hypothetical protein
VADYLNEFKRLIDPLHVQTLPLYEQEKPTNGYMGGQADLTPLKNKAREAAEALNDAQKAADAGRAEDAMEAMRRARAAIDAALGGQIGPHGAMTPPSGVGGPGAGRG